MGLGEIVNVVLAASTVAVAVMAGLSYGSRKALREANEDLRKRIEDLEKDRDRCRDEINTVRAKADADVAELRSTNEVLTRTVTGEVHWKALAESLDAFVRDAHKHWKTEQDVLDALVGHVDRFIEGRRGAPQ